MHREYIALERMKESEKSKRLWQALAVVCVLVAAILITFAPEGRELISYGAGGALLVFALISGLLTRGGRKSRASTSGSEQYSVLNQEKGKM